MTFREALISDIPQLHTIRLAVKENVLSNPALVTENDYIDFLTKRGKGWLGETNNNIVGFAIADLEENNVWALFVDPAWEGRGIGKQLHKLMLDWYFQQTRETIWLSTDPHSKAATFYRLQGWQETGKHGSKEIKFEMSFDSWKTRKETCEK